MKKNILITLLILSTFIVGCESESKPKSRPKSKNVDIVIHSVTGFKGQIIDNKHGYYRRRRSWKVQAYFYPHKIDVNDIQQIKSKKYERFDKVSDIMYIYEFELKPFEEEGSY